MKTLYLLRHAKSSWEEVHLKDFDRPLNKRGRNDAPLMGKVLADKNIKPQLIISSPAVRALTTAIIVAKELQYPQDNIIREKRAYLAHPHELLNIIQKTPQDINELMLVSHNEGITELANLLSPNQIENIPTAGIVSLSFNCASWLEINKKNAKLNLFDFPKNYK
ncbi:histidine phosphatase family protein [soil metagenome]